MSRGGVRGAGGWCCPEDGRHGPCRHLRAFAAEQRAAERLARAHELSSAGLQGLGVLLEAGDPWAQGVLEELLGPDDEAPRAPGADTEGSAVLAGLAPAGFTRTSALPAEESAAGELDAAAVSSAGSDDPVGTAAGVVVTADAVADSDAGAATVEAVTDADAGAAEAADDGAGAPDPEGFVGGGPAWSRALRRRVLEVFDPVVAGEGAASLGVGVGVLAGMRGGADLAAVLTGTEVSRLGRVAGIEVLAAHRRVQAWAAGRVALAAAGLAETATFFDHPRLAGPVDVTGEEIAMRLAVSRQEARTLVRVGQGLTRRFRDTAAALEAGVVDYAKAAAIVTTLQGSPVQVAVQVEARVLEEADGRTVAQVRRDLARALVEVDPQDAQERRVRARARRHVNHTRVLPDGMGSIYAVLPAEDCVQVDLTLDAIAHGAKNDGDARTIDQLRADALLALTHAALITGTTGTTGPPQTPSNADTGTGTGVPDVSDVNDASRTRTRTVDSSPTDGPPPDGPPAPSDDGTPGTPPDGPRADTGSGADSRAASASPPRVVPPGAVPGAAPPGVPVGVEFPPLHQLLLRSCERFTVPDIRVHVTVPLATTLPPEPPGGSEGTALPTTAIDDTGTGTCTGADGSASTGGSASTVGAEGTASTGSGTGAGAGGAEGGAGRTDADTDDADTGEGGGEVGEEAVPAAYLEGYGPITPDLARALAAGGTWRRLVTDPVTGTVTHLGRSVYRP
ncbi:DUF222 domain-containing protein, partial [Georgenia daeguensis]|uniref:DUF222 domain-containing protein n=1 Tax=Georgenia daeguensis TaxID=908355 RepID=UPI0031E56646